MEQFRGWIINICTAVFFITAVEMILPDNKMKKYAKFVLGLILITVIINPLVRFLNRGIDISTYINRSESFFSESQLTMDSERYKNESIDNTLKVFQTNLEKLCEEKLKEKFEKGTYKVKAEVTYDAEKEEYEVKNISVAVSSGRIEKIQKIEINTSSSQNDKTRTPSEMGEEIKTYLSSELKLPEKIIYVYKAGS